MIYIYYTYICVYKDIDKYTNIISNIIYVYICGRS